MFNFFYSSMTCNYKRSSLGIQSLNQIIGVMIFVAIILLNSRADAALKNNSNDICMFYSSSSAPIESVPYTIAYHNSNLEPVDWMINGLVLFTMDLAIHNNPTQTTCDTYVDDLFKVGGLLERLDSVVSNLKTSLNDPNYKLNVFITVPFASDMTDGNVTNNIQTIVDKWAMSNYSNLDFIGFYWGYTETFAKEIPIINIQNAASAVHANALKLLIIPYFGADMSLYSTSGVDYATQQPNYAFAGWTPTDNTLFGIVNERMLLYNTDGIELELTATRNTGLTILENALHYFEAARQYKWNDCFMTTYYHNNYIEAYAKSSNPEMRLIYDKLYRYVTPSLRGEWRFSEADGTIVTDSSEYANNAEIIGAQLTKTGIGGALLLDGVDDYVLIADNSSLDINGAITVEAWVKPNNISNYGVIISRDEYGRRLLLRPGGNVYASFGDTALYTTDSPITVGVWNHIVYTNDGTTGIIYVNGIAVTSGNSGGADFASNYSIFIGKTGGNYWHFDGQIDEVKVYARVLTTTEITTNYQSDYSRMDLAAKWSFGEKYNDTLVYDTSENRNDGEKINGAMVSGDGIDGALVFDGVDDYVFIPDNSSLDINGAITVEAWIKPDNTSTFQTIISRDEYGRRLLLRPGGNVYASFGDAALYTTNAPITAGVWNHVAYTSDGTTGTIYVNGVAVISGNTGGADFSSNAAVFIGRTRGGYYSFNGQIDEVKIYAKALTAADISSTYQQEYKTITMTVAAQWNFDEGTGSLVNDTTENHNIGAVNGANWVSGISGRALHFDGIDDFVIFDNLLNTSLNINESLTVEAWIKPDNTSTFQTIISRDEYGRRLLLRPGGNVYASFGDGALYTTDSPITAGVWNHVIYTSDGATGTIYVNGVAVLSGNSGGADFSNITTNTIFIGKTKGNYYPFKGSIDDVAVYKKQLSADEVLASFEKCKATWLFDENSGNTAYDSTKFNNNGTIVGAMWTAGKNGSALLFDGINDYVIIPDNSSLDINGAITIEAWIKPDNTSTWQTIIGRDEYGKRLLLRPGGNIQADFGTIINTTNSPITAGQWNHVVYVNTGISGAIYVNGVSCATALGKADFSSNKAIFVGKTAGGYYHFKGIIDEVKIYGKFISQ